ncbi:malonyl-[acyl-carrier protein] O-methyltransferase BioC [Solimonas fluminis]|uniref:Malonyl-[acyl-carrier protein] O-methyltransferase n=1 Tax=Solimonas fluminis TaxID=2086571 RepID=A0A2S5TB32_9GAMM|nr:methyltransferase domain-containing protein [Solimonas fluminis]PPE72162.1 malonyl-[acyl-carrier protein] O-methyltransferase BioC [Solimonas fluminis]
MALSRIDAGRAARNFSAAAAGYDRAATLQLRTREALLAELAARAGAPRRLLDLGCGTGIGARRLRALYPGAEVLALDRAPGMVRIARDAGLDALVGDAQRLPLPAACCDAILSNLVLQWCPQPELAMTEACRVLRPGGWLCLSLPGPATLRELRTAWRQVDQAEHVHRFDPASAWLARAEAAGLELHSLRPELLREPHADVFALMRSLRETGVVNASAQRRRGLLGRSALAALERAYAPWRTAEGIVASWEILYLVLRRPTEC